MKPVPFSSKNYYLKCFLRGTMREQRKHLPFNCKSLLDFYPPKAFLMVSDVTAEWFSDKCECKSTCFICKDNQRLKLRIYLYMGSKKSVWAYS